MCVSLVDKNVLVQRTTLDIVSVLFPFHQSFLLPEDLASILTASLQTLLKRDVSLSRRLYAWLLGSQVNRSALVNCLPASNGEVAAVSIGERGDDGGLSAQNTTTAFNLSYFEKYSKSYLNLALRSVLVHARKAAKENLSKTECVLPYRLLRALLDRPEISGCVLEEVMFDFISCLKDQIDALGGLSPTSSGKDSALVKSKTFQVESVLKKPPKKSSLKTEVIQSAHLFFNSLSQDFVWEWMGELLQKCSAKIGPMPASSSDNKSEQLMDGDVMEEAESRTVSPISDLFVSGIMSRKMSQERTQSIEKASSSSEDKALRLTSVLALLMFLMQVIPKVSAPQLKCWSSSNATLWCGVPQMPLCGVGMS